MWLCRQCPCPGPGDVNHNICLYGPSAAPPSDDVTGFSAAMNPARWGNPWRSEPCDRTASQN